MRRTLQPALWLAILTVGLGLVLAACNSGTTPDTTPPTLAITSSATSSGTSYHLSGTVGDNVGASKVTYSVNGGPAKTVGLSGGTFDVTVTLTQGTNAIDVTVYDAAGNETSKTLTVTCTSLGTGALTVTVLGRPYDHATNALAPGDVEVSGPTSAPTVWKTSTLTGLTPGTYTVTPKDVTLNTYIYSGTTDAAGNQIDVTAGTTQTVTVTYAAASADLLVQMTGLSGAYGDVAVSGPTAVHDVMFDWKLTGLEPGTYTLTPKPVTDGYFTYAGTTDLAGDQITLTAATTMSANITYAPTDGALMIAFSGTIPSGASYGATVVGASPSVTRHATTSTAGTVTVGQLPQQQYTVTPDTMPSTTCLAGVHTVYAPVVTPSNTPSVSVGQLTYIDIVYTEVTDSPC